MSRNDFSRLFNHLEALTVGFGPVFRDFQTASPNYPPHNIIQLSDTEYLLELAVAGFKKGEVTLEEHQGVLTITGNKFTENGSEYQHRGIASRNFAKSFRVAEYYEVTDARLEDGILSIKFTKNVPEEAKPKLIAIQ